jgi:hypothetical protein
MVPFNVPTEPCPHAVPTDTIRHRMGKTASLQVLLMFFSGNAKYWVNLDKKPQSFVGFTLEAYFILSPEKAS